MKLEELQKLCDEATEGPWAIAKDDEEDITHIWTQSGKWTGCDSEDEVYNTICQMPTEKSEYGYAWATKPNAKFITATRTYMPKLIEIAKQARMAAYDDDLKDEDWEDHLEKLREALENLEK